MGYTSSSNPQRGEIWIRGPSIAHGYYKNPAKSAETFRDGWLLTGDVGEWHEDGTLSVIDRIKNLVKLSHGECTGPLILHYFILVDLSLSLYFSLSLL